MLAAALLALVLQAERTPWTESKVAGSPDPPAPYHTEPAFPKLTFESPVDLVPMPGTGLLAVAELAGRIHSFPADPQAAEPRCLLTLGRKVLGITFHPQFAQNGFLYAVGESTLKGNLQLARFTLSKDRGWAGSIETEQVLLTWPAHPVGHGGGSLRFGPDGFLYVGIGDGSEGSDPRATGQDLSDLLGSVLRIDVDHPADGKAYGIPKDNPFLGRAGARPEIWAYGVRQPWRISFDRATGDAWAGDVGQDLWEMVLRLRPGGNYGWSVNEGTHPFRPDRPRGPTPILPPVAEHPHSEFRALVGGQVYRGTRLKELAGVYVYGDYESGKVWGLRLENDRVTWKQELASTALRIVSFGEDDQGELYLVNFPVGTIHRLVPGPSLSYNPNFPRKLSETGLFRSLRDLQPSPGVVSYAVNSALWSDGAAKERHLALPGSSKIGFQDVPNRAFLEAPRGWAFPDGTVLVKTFSLETGPGKRRRVETRLLHLQKVGEGGVVHDYFWRGYSYEWNEDQTDAELVDAAGRDRVIPRGSQPQTWRFPSRTECMQCHSLSAQFVLGVTTLQMNRDIPAEGGRINQLTALERLGMFRKPLPGPPADLPRLADYEDRSQDIDRRARAYLHANCAQCHTMFGGGNSAFQLQANLALEETGIVGAAPVHGTLGIPDARLLAPGDPERSLVYRRMGLTHAGRMPPLATSIVDEQGMELIGEWIRGLDPDRRNWRSYAGGGAILVLAAAFLGLRLRRGFRPGSSLPRGRGRP